MDFMIWVIGVVLVLVLLGLVWLYMKVVSKFFKIVVLLIVFGVLGGGAYYWFNPF